MGGVAEGWDASLPPAQAGAAELSTCQLRRHQAQILWRLPQDFYEFAASALHVPAAWQTYLRW